MASDSPSQLLLMSRPLNSKQDLVLWCRPCFSHYRLTPIIRRCVDSVLILGHGRSFEGAKSPTFGLAAVNQISRPWWLMLIFDANRERAPPMPTRDNDTAVLYEIVAAVAIMKIDVYFKVTSDDHVVTAWVVGFIILDRQMADIFLSTLTQN